ncbi:MAG: methyltransferase [Candidatus Parcubacteria bacterium]|nr:MAG: methyltransferase [Candidatus Parcubacteria bacterium]GIW67666.1 MAG: methyltransferase [Candidatus Parcubacteria bacterium]
MEPKKDAYGQEIWAFFQGKESYEIIERDDGFVDLSGGPSVYFADFEKWPKHEKEAIKFVKGKVLDVGAGAGRVSLYLQKRGFDVLAIDNSPLAIKICKRRGIKKAKVLPFEKIEKLRPVVFDTVIMFGNNFGLFGNPKKARKLLKKLSKLTTQKALIIAESNDPYKTKDPAHLSYHKFNRKRGRMPGQLRIRIRFRNYIGDWFDYLIVSKKEMKEILKDTGWRIKKFIDSEKSYYIAIIEKE